MGCVRVLSPHAHYGNTTDSRGVHLLLTPRFFFLLFDSISKKRCSSCLFRRLLLKIIVKKHLCMNERNFELTYLQNDGSVIHTHTHTHTHTHIYIHTHYTTHTQLLVIPHDYIFLTYATASYYILFFTTIK